MSKKLPKHLSVPQFTTVVVSKAPMQTVFISFLFLIAGLLELFSIAMLLPVFLSILDSAHDTGFAGSIIARFGIPTVSLRSGLAIVIVLMSLRGGFLFIADVLIAKIARDIEVDTRKRLLSSLLYSSWEYLISRETGNIANLILREVERSAQAIQKLGQLFSAILISSILIGASVLVSWQAFLVFTLAVIPYMVITRTINKRIKANARCRLREANKISVQVRECSGHLKYIKAGGIERLVIDKFEETVRAYAHYFLRIVLYARLIKHFPEVFGIIILGCLVLFSQQYLGENPTDIIFFLLLLFRGYRQIANVQTIFSTLVENIPSYEVCENIISEAADHQEQFPRKPLEISEHLTIKLKNVEYTYKGALKPALKDINLSLPPSGLTAIVGASGAGKTTLGDLLLGLITPDKGDIIINDVQRLSEINLQQWRQNIGYVPQEPFLISGTIRQNILLGNSSCHEKEIFIAAEQARIDEFVRQLPNGYDTQIGDFGIRLSGGQRQRIAIARALVRNPNFLILDEATSALDTKTEKDVQEAINDIAQERPVVVIAHRLSTIREANMICVLHENTIVEQGRFEDLISNKGYFWNLNNVSAEL